MIMVKYTTSYFIHEMAMKKGICMKVEMYQYTDMYRYRQPIH